MSPIVLIRMFLRPLFFWLVALSLFLYLRVFVADLLSDSTYLIGLTEVVRSKAVWIASIPFTIGALLFVQRLQLLYWWSSDENQGCDSCGAPQDEKNGRYGPYRKCFLCGATKSGWQ